MRPVLRSSRVLALIAGLIAVSLLGAAVLVVAQQRQREALEERFQDRADLAAQQLSTFAKQTIARQRQLARARLSTRRVSRMDFETAVAAAGHQAALLLDAQGRVLASAPRNPELLGQAIADEYPHLRQAVAGRPAVSPVVLSAVERKPIVAFAVPFRTAMGRRVFSSGYPVTATPLGGFLARGTALPGARFFLLDSSEKLMLSSVSGRPSVQGGAPGRRLEAAAARSTAGRYDDGGSERYFARSEVEGAPWQALLSVETEQLFKPVSGFSRWFPWLVLAALVLAGMVVIRLVARLLLLRESLQRLADEDALTGLLNRRRFEQELDEQVARARRYGESSALLLLDLDHFKAVNDTYGHKAGDDLIRAVGDALVERLRATDRVARLGGDEFAVLLNKVDADQASLIAEELRTTLGGLEVSVDGATVRVTASVGVAFITRATTSAEQALGDADIAMYDAKAAGRNRINGMRERQHLAAAEGERRRRIRVFHCDDSDSYRRLLLEMLSAQPDIDVIGGAASPREAREPVARARPDVLLLDAMMDGNTVATLQDLRLASPASRVIVLTGAEPGASPVIAAADGYVHKGQSFDAIAESVREAAGRS